MIGQAGHWRAPGAVNAPHMLWWFDSIPAHQTVIHIPSRIAACWRDHGAAILRAAFRVEHAGNNQVNTAGPGQGKQRV